MPALETWLARLSDLSNDACTATGPGCIQSPPPRWRRRRQRARPEKGRFVVPSAIPPRLPSPPEIATAAELKRRGRRQASDRPPEPARPIRPTYGRSSGRRALCSAGQRPGSRQQRRRAAVAERCPAACHRGHACHRGQPQQLRRLERGDAEVRAPSVFDGPRSATVTASPAHCAFTPPLPQAAPGGARRQHARGRRAGRPG